MIFIHFTQGNDRNEGSTQRGREGTQFVEKEGGCFTTKIQANS